jgi:adenylosuccinate lyase
MPLPDRYAEQVPDILDIWEPAGYFRAQTKIWMAQSEARHELYSAPTGEELEQIRLALHLTPDDITDLTHAQGHETNRLLRTVQERLSPEVGNYIHKGNTSSDVLDTSMTLQIVESLGIVESDFYELGESLKSLALKHKDTLQVGRTHGQQAIPQTFGRQVLGWYAEVERGLERITRARDVISYGKCSGEIGTNVFITADLEELALAKLGLKPDPAPTQIISRDRHAEVLALMAINGGTLARIATNIRLLSITEIGEVREPFEGVGSSAMPQKRNPEKMERVVGLNRRIRGAVSEELDASVVWLERDMTHSSTERYTFPDIFGNLAYAARLSKEVIDRIEVNPERMLENLNKTYGAIYSSRLLNVLLENQIPRTQAYELVKGLSQQAMDTKTELRELVSSDPQIAPLLSGEAIDDIFDPNFYLRNIDVGYKRLGILPE